jgi:uncharacterized protein
MNKKTRLLFITLAALLCFLFVGASVSPTREFYVNDYANVLSPANETYILDQSASLEGQTGAQIVVLTVNSLEGKTSSQYALEVGRDWGIGDQEKNNGLLILLSVEDRQIRVEVGPGLEGALNDAKVGRLIDNYALAYYQQNDFDQGTLELYKAILSEVMKEYGLEGLEGYQDVETPLTLGDFLGPIAILTVLSLIYFFAGRGGSGGSGTTRYGPGPFFGGFWGGGGGFGSGSGGFGGFSGGGGGFRGGGAGRGF